ncbi:MAG: hypothetical protein WAX22_02865 [Lactococcus hircilactis]|uniref:hypothetical protein n=1 Tax=Lactococcus hircilactis TaxID=1494462 RepID=UPI003BD9EE66
MKIGKKKILGASATALVLIGGMSATTSRASASTSTSSIPVYRLYNKNTGEHFYTESLAEKNNLANVGWNYEGIGWQAAPQGESVYRVYNPNAKGGDHYYTLSKYEAQSLVKVGWKWDNGGKPVFYSGGNTNLYVAYNPNAQSGAHNFTTSSAEQSNLLNVGWKYGAVAWKVAGAGSSSQSTTPSQRDYSKNTASGPINQTGTAADADNGIQYVRAYLTQSQMQKGYSFYNNYILSPASTMAQIDKDNQKAATSPYVPNNPNQVNGNR